MIVLEHVSVGVMLHFMATGIQPVVKDLAAEDMPSDAPEVLPAPQFQELLALAGDIPIRTDTETHPLEKANEVLLRMKESRINGAAVLTI